MSRFDVSSVPFSFRGSWMSIAIPKGRTELYFRNHHIKANDLFRIETIVDGEMVEPTIEAEPACLRLRCGNALAEICFDGPDRVRVRGVGLSLRLSGEKNHAYNNGPGMAVFNLEWAVRRYQFKCLNGSLELVDTHDAETGRRGKALLIDPDEKGAWELSIDEFWSSWRPSDLAPFDQCVAAATSSFETFLATMPPAPEAFMEARRLAGYVNWSCIVNPSGHIKRPTVFMSKNWMNHVWSWDQCFNALAMIEGQPELAMDQMLTLVDHQDEFGAFPDCFNDVRKQYNYSKPPVHGLIFREMRKRLTRPLSNAIMETMYRSLGAQADWWMTYRRLDGQALPYYLHGNDSGWDNSTMFGQGVPLIGPDLSALLVDQMDLLAELADEAGLDEEAARWRARSEQLFAAMMNELWQGDSFVAKLAINGRPVPCESLIPNLVLVLGERLPEEVRACLRARIEGHLTEWGLATEHVDSPMYKPDGYWRGPIWAPSTFLAVTGLDRCGYTELADTIAERFCALCAKSGFAENFNAVTGEPLRDKAYTWTSSVFLLMAQRLSGSESGGPRSATATDYPLSM